MSKVKMPGFVFDGERKAYPSEHIWKLPIPADVQKQIEDAVKAEYGDVDFEVSKGIEVRVFGPVSTFPKKRVEKQLF